MTMIERNEPDRWGYTRYAVVLSLPEDDRLKVDAVRARLPLPTAMIPAHVTVKGSFDSPTDLDEVCRQMREIARRTRPFDVELLELSERESGLGYSVTVSPEMRALHDALYEAIEPISRNVYGGREAGSDFHPHMTVTSELPVGMRVEEKRVVATLNIDTRFKADAMHLMGLVGPRHGGRWQVVEAFQFGDARPDFIPIGVVRSSVSEPVDEGWGEVVSEIHLEARYAAGLEGIEQFSHAVIVTWLHLATFDSPKHLRRRPRGRSDMPCVGMFAQRARHRPNPIGITSVRILGVQGNVLRVQGLDAIDGTPVLDVRPYYPAFDLVPDATVPEWVDRLMEGYL
jgi:tRNA-Thr(GGU) m(6)t(6)A37 methyltransferase TsaA